MKNKKKFFGVILILFVCSSSLFLQGFDTKNNNKIDLRLSGVMNLSAPGETFLVWIKFNDKGPDADSRLDFPGNIVTTKSIQRRLKVKDAQNLVDFTDLPVYAPYIEDLKNSGIEIKNISKWFNSVSCYITKEQAEQITRKAYIEKIDKVLLLKKSGERVNKKLTVSDNTKHHEDFGSASDVLQINYGQSLNQSQMINVPLAHDNGYTGQGVLIASFDAGVDNLIHPCFDSIRARGLRTYDFVNGDTNVMNQQGQQGPGYHGTLTLSLIAGYAPGNLISPAFGSKFLVAKTENVGPESIVEEDNWIAAAEWADSLGADIITSSLGYLHFDPGSPYSYDWTWMNGDSCRLTIAADLAVNKGIIVVTSAGNSGNNTEHNTLDSPADGDSVLTVGAIGYNGFRWGNSSVGPTTDGRIKPDVMAVGTRNVTAAVGAGNEGYSSNEYGTSLATPMVAGVCAIILSANPNLTPMQVIDIIRHTSSNASAPDRYIGWGTVNAWAAVQEALELINGEIPVDYVLNQNYPNPFNPVTVIPYGVSYPARITIKVYDMLGTEVDVLVNGFHQKGNYKVSFDGRRHLLPSGIYYYSLLINDQHFLTKKMVLVK
jgi:subtilisin family serine protease